MASRLVINELSSADAANANRILQDAFAYLNATGVVSTPIVAALKRNYSMERLTKLLSGVHTISRGVYRDGVLIGCVWGYLWEDEVFSVDWAVVTPSVIGTGVFSQLMVAIEEAAYLQGAHKSFLYVLSGNDAAIKRYGKLGYAVEGLHPMHFFKCEFTSMGKILHEERPGHAGRTPLPRQ